MASTETNSSYMKKLNSYLLLAAIQLRNLSCSTLAHMYVHVQCGLDKMDESQKPNELKKYRNK